MQVEARHIASKKRIGTLHGQAVTELLLKGGLVLVATVKDGKPQMLAAAPHVAVARYMAERAEPDIELTELSKSEEVSLAGILSVVDRYQKLTDNWNSALTQFLGNE
jgi:hypothetical protein